MITSKSVEVQLKIFCRLSFPMEILSDNGSKVTSSFMKEVFQAMMIAHIKTSPYRLQTCGSIKKSHHTLMQMVRKYETLKKDWDETPPMLLFARRDVRLEATGFSPF